MEVRDLHVHFELRANALMRLLGAGGRRVRAVDGVDLTRRKGEVLGLVGESGSGKSTLGRALLGLVRPTSGEIRYRDLDLATLRELELRTQSPRLLIYHQDPHA